MFQWKLEVLKKKKNGCQRPQRVPDLADPPLSHTRAFISNVRMLFKTTECACIGRLHFLSWPFGVILRLISGASYVSGSDSPWRWVFGLGSEAERVTPVVPFTHLTFLMLCELRALSLLGACRG